MECCSHISLHSDPKPKHRPTLSHTHTHVCIPLSRSLPGSKRKQQKENNSQTRGRSHDTMLPPFFPVFPPNSPPQRSNCVNRPVNPTPIPNPNTDSLSEDALSHNPRISTPASVCPAPLTPRHTPDVLALNVELSAMTLPGKVNIGENNP